MADVNFTLLPGPPLRVRVIGPYSDEAILQFFYGDSKKRIVRDKNDPSLIFLDFTNSSREPLKRTLGTRRIALVVLERLLSFRELKHKIWVIKQISSASYIKMELKRSIGWRAPARSGTHYRSETQRRSMDRATAQLAQVTCSRRRSRAF